MMKLAWITDPHFNFLSAEALTRFCENVAKWNPSAVILSGDIAEAESLGPLMRRLAELWAPRPLYFVLGNHDFYGGSITEVKEGARALAIELPQLTWLEAVDDAIALSPTVGLLGCDGWADARLGNFAASKIMLNDYLRIRDLTLLDPNAGGMTALARKLNALGDTAAAHVRRVLPKALDRFEHVFFVTHVPPFKEACWHENNPSDDDWLPHFSCKAVGDAMIEVMSKRKDRKLTVLCGHTHSGGEFWPLSNVHVRTGDADYGSPRAQPPIWIA